MPQPLRRNDIKLSFEPNQLLTRPALAAEIGNICATWGLVEITVALLYSVLMGGYLPKQHEQEVPGHPLAFQVFEALNALSPRLELVGRLVKWREPGLVDKWSGLEKKLRRRFTERSVVAHGFWAVSDELPEAIVLMSVFGQTLVYEVKDLRAISDRIARDYGELQNFLATCKTKRGGQARGGA